MRSDRAAVSTPEALERVRNGLFVQIREGSAARDFDPLLLAVTEHAPILATSRSARTSKNWPR